MGAKRFNGRFASTIFPSLFGFTGLAIFILFPHGYHMGLFIVYSSANLFAYLRLKRLLAAGRLEHRAFPLLYLLMAVAYPCVELLSHTSRAGILKYLLLFGYFTLPYMLYLFLLLALAEAARLLLRRLSWGRRRFMRSPKFAAVALALLLGGPMGIVILGGIHYEDIRVNPYRVEVPARAARIDRLRIALAADFHVGDVTEPRRIERVIRAINSAKPDIVLLAGDLVEGDRQDIDLRRYARLFGKLRATYGVYASLGNHDFHWRGDRDGFFRRAGIQVLDDRFVVIADSFCLAGRSDRKQEFKKPLARVLSGAPAGLPVILMDHRPSGFAETLGQRVDIQLSGHSHHGQFFPINWITGLKYDLSWGHRRIAGTHFFVTCGAQAWGPPSRTAGDSEVMLIDVDFARTGTSRP